MGDERAFFGNVPAKTIANLYNAGAFNAAWSKVAKPIAESMAAISRSRTSLFGSIPQSRREILVGDFANPVLKDKYADPDLAAIAVISRIGPQSIDENLEYGGRIYQNPDGTYSYTGPYRGNIDKAFVGLAPDGSLGVGSYHTHGAYDPNFPNSDNFSPTDIQTNFLEGVTGYLGTPSGNILKHTPGEALIHDPGTVEVIGHFQP